MPLVFVHGVNNRMRAGYQEATAARNALFRRFTLTSLVPSPDAATILNPYWGARGANFRWGLACLPIEDDTESLGGAEPDPLLEPLAAAAVAQAGSDGAVGNLLVAVARSDFPGMIDVVFAAGAVEAGDDADAFAETAARAAAYADAHREPPTWLADTGSDEEFLDRLQAEIQDTLPATPAAGTRGALPEEFEALGIEDPWGAFRVGAERLRVAAGDAVGTKAYGLIRRHVAPTLATFFGDVFEYLSHRGTPEQPGRIPAVVVQDLRRAADAVTDKDPHLVVVGHSIGGVIAYDLLTSFVPTVHVDALVTVGSQVGLFEELKLFLDSDPAVPAAGVPRLARPRAVDH